MSDKKKTVAEIQQEYSQGCARAGHAQYQIYTLTKELDLLNESLKSLNIEAAKASAEEEASKKEASVIKAVETAKDATNA